MIKNRLIFFALCLGVGLVSLSSSALATSKGFDLTTYPLPIELNTKPGEEVSTSLKVENSGTTPTKVKVELKKFYADPKTGDLTLDSRQNGDDYFDWVSFSESEFVAKPNVWHSIQMTIRTPTTAAFGYYYAVVFNQLADSSQDNTSNAKIRGGVATLVLLDVNAPGEKRKLSVDSFVSTKKIYEYLPANFEIKIRNTGNTHVVPAGDIFLSKNGHDNIAVIPINGSSGNVLPSSTRTFNTAWSDGFPVFANKTANGQIVVDSKQRPIKQLTWNFNEINKFRFGKYKAHLFLTYNDGKENQIIEGDVSFWVIPWKILPVFLAILALIGLGLWSALKPLVKKLREKPKNTTKNNKG